MQPLEERSAKAWQAEAGPVTGKGKKSGGGKLPQAVKGKTRDKVAAYVGVSGRTFEKAKAVVDAAQRKPIFNVNVMVYYRTQSVDTWPVSLGFVPIFAPWQGALTATAAP